MTFVTHREFSIIFIYLGAIALYNSGVSHVNYYLALIIMLKIGKAGALFPDIDHEWQNVKEKTTGNWVVNKIIHLLGGKHRSWVTHSIDIAAWFCMISYFGPKYLLQRGMIDQVNYEVLSGNSLSILPRLDKSLIFGYANTCRSKINMLHEL